jgi:predicted RNase H-like HicB family nuclease
MDRIETSMTLDDYKVVLYRNQPSGWVAEVPAIEGCYALVPTSQEALAELGRVFEMISAEFQEKGGCCRCARTAPILKQAGLK